MHLSISFSSTLLFMVGLRIPERRKIMLHGAGWSTLLLERIPLLLLHCIALHWWCLRSCRCGADMRLRDDATSFRIKLSNSSFEAKKQSKVESQLVSSWIFIFVSNKARTRKDIFTLQSASCWRNVWCFAEHYVRFHLLAVDVVMVCWGFRWWNGNEFHFTLCSFWAKNNDLPESYGNQDFCIN